MASKISSKNYENATYKSELSIWEHNTLVSSVVESIINLYDQAVYGLNEYITNEALVEYCTNINISKLDMDKKYKFFTETDVLEKIKASLGEAIYIGIMRDIDLGIRYRISTNPEVKGLLIGIGNLMDNLTKNTENISDETLTELMGMAKSLATGADSDADQ